MPHETRTHSKPAHPKLTPKLLRCKYLHFSRFCFCISRAFAELVFGRNEYLQIFCPFPLFGHHLQYHLNLILLRQIQNFESACYHIIIFQTWYQIGFPRVTQSNLIPDFYIVLHTDIQRVHWRQEAKKLPDWRQRMSRLIRRMQQGVRLPPVMAADLHWLLAITHKRPLFFQLLLLPHHHRAPQVDGHPVHAGT